MSDDALHARHAAQLTFLENPLHAEGWTTQMLPPGSQMPVTALVAAPPAAFGSPPVIFAYVPLNDDDDRLDLLQMIIELPLLVPPARTDEVMRVVMALNTSLPIGTIGIAPTRNLFVRHIYGHRINTMPNGDEVASMAMLMAGTVTAFINALRSVIGGASADEVTERILSQTLAVDLETPSLFEQVTDYLTRKNLKYENERDMAAIVTIRGRNAQFNLVVQVRAEDKQLIVYALSPVMTPAERLMEMALFLTMANYGVYIGNFEMDVRDGEVRYKTSQTLHHDLLADEIIGSLIQHAAGAFDQYAAGIKAVAEGTASAQDAIRQIEG